jgi:hypothetical protein
VVRERIVGGVVVVKKRCAITVSDFPLRHQVVRVPFDFLKRDCQLGPQSWRRFKAGNLASAIRSNSWLRVKRCQLAASIGRTFGSRRYIDLIILHSSLPFRNLFHMRPESNRQGDYWCPWFFAAICGENEQLQQGGEKSSLLADDNQEQLLETGDSRLQRLASLRGMREIGRFWD